MSIWIETKGTALRLRWRYEGKRYCLGLGVQNNPTGEAFANQKKAQIEMDMIVTSSITCPFTPSYA
jgi:integrase